MPAIERVSVSCSYGRDKCAYSRELNAAGYQFFVLHGVYAVNVAEASGQKSILRR